ncbi:MAG TPA: S9 family peptidase [Acidobacteriaceae bacterium]|jgi:dipeptidyl aminopeptidase/acylaminoacyl peptidase|nr:S9 family peptidase [Acidobacteriaceae bacterium]
MRGQVYLGLWLLAGLAAGRASRTFGQNAGPDAAAHANGKRPMTFEDMMRMRRLGDLAVSPDGKWVLFTVTDVDLGRNTKTPHLWIVPVAGGDEKALTDGATGESRGRFSPDGKQIAFLNGRGGSEQIWLADFDTVTGTMGDPRPLTQISTEGDNVTWSPDGKHLLFTSAVYPECSAGPGGAAVSGADEDACDQKRDEDVAQSKVKAKIFTGLLYRHWNGFTGDKRSHLFLASVEDGSFRDLNPGDTHDVPPFSLGEPDGWDFSPDGKEIAFEEKKVDDPALSTSVAIYTLRLDDPNAQPVKISTSAGGNFTPRYSPDGRWIAWRSQARAGYESDRFRLVVYAMGEAARDGAASRSASQRVSKSAGPTGGKSASQRVSESAASGAIREVLPHFDRWVDEEAWGPDSKTIYFAFGDYGEERIDSVDADGSHLTKLARNGEFGDLHATSDGSLLIASKTTVRAPSEIVALHLDAVEPITAGTLGKREPPPGFSDAGAYRVVHEAQLSHLNDALLGEVEMPEMETFFFPSIGKVQVQGFLIRPPGFDASKKYPVKFLIHGGPEGAWGDSWSYRWNPELFAANGYLVVMINPGGSTGYGQAFVDRVNGDWGGKPYVDLMRGLDYAEQHYPFIDKTRECALGASYGGYMADWILGHTDRFKCIVTHDGMFNTESAYGTTDELWFNEWEFRGTPWSNRALYRKWSPMLAETHFKTPTLVVHSQLDYRLDVSEGYQLFDTLQRMKVASKMLYFPDEGHWVLKPQNSQLWYRTVDDWVDQWTRSSH